jgi:hypothetical protein
MTRYVLAGAFALATMTGGVLAQGIPSDSNSSEGPAASETITKHERTIDGNGGVTEKSQIYDKSQSYSDGGGELSSHTTVKKSEQTTVTPPPAPPPMSTTTTTTTTTEGIQH